jgi:hypothetical protein
VAVTDRALARLVGLRNNLATEIQERTDALADYDARRSDYVAQLSGLSADLASLDAAITRLGGP